METLLAAVLAGLAGWLFRWTPWEALMVYLLWDILFVLLRIARKI